MARKKTAYAINKNGYHLVIDDVPAWVCQQCGEPYFEGQEVDVIQEVIRAVDSRILKAQFAKA
jgi:YgiT-type zinc finger domain-containing protein